MLLTTNLTNLTLLYLATTSLHLELILWLKELPLRLQKTGIETVFTRRQFYFPSKFEYYIPAAFLVVNTGYIAVLDHGEAKQETKPVYFSQIWS